MDARFNLSWGILSICSNLERSEQFKLSPHWLTGWRAVKKSGITIVEPREDGDADDQSDYVGNFFQMEGTLSTA